jgi:hypothetical protein
LFLTFKNGTNRPVFKWYLQNGRQQAIWKLDQFVRFSNDPRLDCFIIEKGHKKKILYNKTVWLWTIQQPDKYIWFSKWLSEYRTVQKPDKFVWFSNGIRLSDHLTNRTQMANPNIGWVQYSVVNCLWKESKERFSFVLNSLAHELFENGLEIGW